MNQEPISFECYCVEILNIPYYNFLSMDEWENCHKKYEEYLEKLYDENMEEYDDN
jgi:ABC-type transporter MlaC component